MATREKIILGSRGSELARAQTQMVVERLRAQWPLLEIDTRVIKTVGDAPQNAVVDRKAGRKGLFTGEIERALIASEIDIGVHSAKDLPSELAPGTEVSAVLPRAPVDDVIISKADFNLQSQPQSGVVATGSVRRKHQLRWQRSDLTVVELRGNVPTRLQKLIHEKWDAIVLARAGLERLGINCGNDKFTFAGADFCCQLLPLDLFLPAGGQGVIAVQTRSEDHASTKFVEPINDMDTQLCLRAEREFLRLLNADCDQPVGVLATLSKSAMKVRAQIFDAEDGSPRVAVVDGPADNPEKLASRLFDEISMG